MEEKLRFGKHRSNRIAFALGLLWICTAGVTLAAVPASATQTTTTLASSSAHGTSGSPTLNLAESEALPATAYPSGWRDIGSSAGIKHLSYFSGYQKNEEALLARCLRVSVRDIQTNPVELTGQQYESRDSYLLVDEDIEIFRSASAAAIDTQAAANPRTPMCNKHLPESETGVFSANGITTDIISVRVIVRSIQHYGDHDAELEYVVHEKIPKYHLAFVAYSDWVYIQKGRSEALLVFTSEKNPIPGDFIAGLAQAAANRLTLAK